MANYHFDPRSSSLWNALDDRSPTTDDTLDQAPTPGQVICTQLVPNPQIAPSCKSSPREKYASCPKAPCGSRDVGTSKVCGTKISCGDVSKHFRDVHGIKQKKWNELIPCSWDACGVTVQRKFFVRHIYGVHLGHHRTNIPSHV
ncbi:hypothetical protein BS17DRAFT_772395 [Gyrodon lividus]|nr:hypothetical protein BS17DRAFT_772395 [Gyrodon lividus]